MVMLSRLSPILAALAATAAMAGPAAPAASEPAATASAPQRVVAHARPRASAACAAHPPDSAAVGHVTSKVRHIPDESDPCADSRGVALPPVR